jgi:hypothetical protein
VTAPDVRTAAQAEVEATAHFGQPDFSVPNDRTIKWATYVQAFGEGAVWGAALVADGIRLTDFQGDGVYRDAGGVIWQRMEATREAVETAIAATSARLTPTREQIAEALYNKHPRSQTRPWNETPRMTREIYREDADAVLALLRS